MKHRVALDPSLLSQCGSMCGDTQVKMQERSGISRRHEDISKLGIPTLSSNPHLQFADAQYLRQFLPSKQSNITSSFTGAVMDRLICDLELAPQLFKLVDDKLQETRRALEETKRVPLIPMIS